MIVVSIGMIYGKSKAGNANGNDRTYIEESEKKCKTEEGREKRKRQHGISKTGQHSKN